MDVKIVSGRPRKTLPDRYAVELTAAEVARCYHPGVAKELGIKAGILCVQMGVKQIDSVISPLYSSGVEMDSVQSFLDGMSATRSVADIAIVCGLQVTQEALAAVTISGIAERGVTQ